VPIYHLMEDAATAEIADREGSAQPAHAGKVEFSDIPVTEVLSRDSFPGLALGTEALKRDYEWWKPRLRTLWKDLEQRQAIMGGHRIGAPKYDDANYKEEWKFEAALRRADDIFVRDHPVRFLMRGAWFIKQASIDLDSLQRGLDLQKANRLVWCGLNPPDLWQEVVDMRRAVYEEFDVTTYDRDVVTLQDGLYRAPYIPKEVSESPDYIDFDDIYRVALLEGERPSQALRLFGAIAHSLGGDKLWNSELRYHIDSYLSMLRSGVVFFDRDAAFDAIDSWHDTPRGRSKLAKLGNALIEQWAVEYEETALYNKMVLGGSLLAQ